MGFKELTKFNDAILAKQVWKLIHDKNSLFYRVFKSKYFPHGTIFEAKQSSGSFSWKSILKARKVIIMGTKWKVGDGQTIRVFKDCWLPGMDSDADLWNDQVIDTCFLPFEAQQIKAIPLCVYPQVDFLYWAREQDGVYSMKSGYKSICEDARNEEASASNSAAATDLWSGIWKLKVPGKIKHLLWWSIFFANKRKFAV